MFKTLRQLHWSVYSLSFASGVIMTGFMMMLPLLPAYSQELGFEEFSIGLLVGAYFIGRVLFQFPLGVLSDQVGRRRLIWASLLLFTIATAAYALATDIIFMIFLRLLLGVASSTFVVTSQAFVNDLTLAGQRGLANGVMGSAINVGVIAGPLLGGILSQAYSIRAPFWVGAALGVVSLFLTLKLPRAHYAETPGVISVAVESVRFKLRRMLSVVLSLPAFVLSLVHFLQMMGLGIILTATPVMTAETLGWSANEIALSLALGGALAAVLSPWLGSLSDRFGRTRVMAGGLAVMAAEGIALFLHPGTAITMAALAIGGGSAPAYYNAFYSLEGDATFPRERGALTGFVGSFGEWGSIIGSSLVTPLVWRAISVSAPMAVDAALLVAAVVLAMAMRPVLEYGSEWSARIRDQD